MGVAITNNGLQGQTRHSPFNNWSEWIIFWDQVSTSFQNLRHVHMCLMKALTYFCCAIIAFRVQILRLLLDLLKIWTGPLETVNQQVALGMNSWHQILCVRHFSHADIFLKNRMSLNTFGYIFIFLAFF